MEHAPASLRRERKEAKIDVKAMTYRQTPDAQPHFGVFFHEYPPEHVSHDDDDQRSRSEFC